MTYTRVIPRDLFNEANLLKCLGQLYLHLDKLAPSTAHLVLDTDEYPFFKIEQNPADGSIWVSNIALFIGGDCYHVSRPLNSREPWPLYAEDTMGNMIPVFTETGALSDQFYELIRRVK